MVHVEKTLFKKCKKNHKIKFFFFLNKVEEKKIIEEQLLRLKKNIGVCTVFIVFMINLANLEINYQRLSLSLILIC